MTERDWMIPRIAVIATHNRPAELRRVVEAIHPQCDRVCVVDNASSPPVAYADFDDTPGPYFPEWIISDPEQPPNLSRLWNLGVDRAANMCRRDGFKAWDVAVLNDDAVPPPGWWDAVSGAMRRTGAVAGSSAPFDDLPAGHSHLWGADAPMSVATRLAGWAMLLRGEWDGARFDESMRWWGSDDDISLRARQAGGIVHVGGCPVPNTGANTSTVGLLAEQAGRDMARFVEKWGFRPW